MSYSGTYRCFDAGRCELQVAAIILAAGKGKRMNSDLPKVLHTIRGRPMLFHVIDAVRSVGPERVVVVTGYAAESVEAAVAGDASGAGVEFVRQYEQLGTGHAVIQAEATLAGCEGEVLVLNGDVPGLTSATLTSLLDFHRREKATATVVTAKLEDPTGYGRIVRSSEGHLEKIVEHRDATDDERTINEINSGLFCFDASSLFAALKQTNRKNAQNEFYLTDVVAVLSNDGKRVSAFCVDDQSEILGVNDVEELATLRRLSGDAP